MRINFNLWNAGVSGGNRTVFSLANGLAERGHEITITALDRGGTHEWFGDVKAKFNYVGLNLLQKGFRKYFMRGWDVDWQQALMNAIPECDINVATYCFTAYSTYLSEIGRPFYLVQNYEPWFFHDTPSQLKAILSYSLPMRKLVVSNWLKKKVGGTYIGNGVDLNKFFPVCERGDPPKILLFARGIPWKGEDLAKWFSNRDTLMTVMNENRTIYPSVTIVNGKMTEKQLVREYSSSSCLIFVSKFEGFGLIPLEAMACGCPVITTSCLGLNEYIEHKKNAYVMKDTNYSSILEALGQILTNRKLRDILIKGGFKTAYRHNFEDVVDGVERIFRTENQ